MKKSVITAMFITLLLVLIGCEQKAADNKPVLNNSTAAPSEQAVKETVPAVEAFRSSFEVKPLDKELEQRINGVSWKEGSPVSMNELSYVKVAYWGFDDRGHMGELIVNKAVAQDVADIFEELYENKFPIEKIRLIDEYDADDTKSMENNNTSAFNYREVEGKPGKLSKHSYGLAVDINPVQNPYIYKNEISPEAGEAYINRETIKKGMITKADICYKAFTSRGWIWGGDWKYEKDYQHFQKNIDTK